MTTSISHTEKMDRGRYWVDTEAGEAELTYTLGQDERMIIGGTFVPREARGLGVAMALVRKVVADARALGRKIEPLCPYVDRVFTRHPEWRDLLAS